MPKISDKDIKNLTEELLRRSIYCYYFKSRQPKTKHVILDRLFPSQSSSASLIKGLQTSLGTFWENLAEVFAKKIDFEVIPTKELQQPKNIPTKIRKLIEKHQRARKDSAGGTLDDFKDDLNTLVQSLPRIKSFVQITKGQGVDLILERPGAIYIFDVKTVQINANSGNSYSDRLFDWLAYFKIKNPKVDAHEINPMMVFPYSPFDINNDKSWWGNFEGRAKPLHRKDVFVGNQFWEFVTGNDKALLLIVSAFDSLSQETEFVSFFNEVFKITKDQQFEKFAYSVKYKWISEQKKVEVLNREDSMRKKMTWIHCSSKCTFDSRIKPLIESNQFKCPKCGKMLGEKSPFKEFKL